MMNEYRRFEKETDDQLIYRISQDKDKIGTWQNVADILNTILGAHYSESCYRKKFQSFSKMLEANQDKFVSSDLQAEELKQLRRELAKEKQKLSDERVEYNRLIRNEARKESYIDIVKRVISENTPPINVPVHYTLYNSDVDLLCHLTDIHTGIEIDNWKNKFNEHVLKQRIEKYTSDILDVRGFHQAENLYLVIGELVSGIIHNNLRLQNNMDLIEQFKYICELISGMLVRLANNFSNVYVYTTPGNHSRISPKKEDALDGENLDIIAPFYLKARLQNLKNVHICDNNIDPEIAMFNIRNQKIFAAHGHKDSVSNVVQNFTLMYGVKPDIVLLGHRHTNGLTTIFDTKVIQSGCVSGQDQFAASLRKANRPEQMVSVIGDDGLICLYDIQLD